MAITRAIRGGARAGRGARGLIALVLMLSLPVAEAQTWPARPIRLLTFTPPGGAPDISARVLAERLTPVLGQPVVVETRTGSNGNIAAEMVAHAPADGHTLLLCADSQLVINPHVYARMPYEQRDIVPIATVASNEFFLVANPSQPFRTFREFVDYARKASPPLAYASGGNGSQHQLTMEMLKARLGIELVHVPYKGAAPATTAVIAGEVPVEFAGSTAGPQVRAGKLRGLAIAGPHRLAAFPDLPTISEFVPGFVNSIWLAVCGPRNLPEPVVERLRTEVNRQLAQPEVREAFARSGALEPLVTTREELAALVRRDYEKYGQVVRTLGVKTD
jgi:tripartite-type tricarboxylate transporter receptor subunit TctC